MPSPPTPEERRALRRQIAALRTAEHDHEDPGHTDAAVRWADERRQAEGSERLRPWWAGKTELELHERARALGLLD